MNDYLFGELRFVGNELQYEDPRNSFLNQVLERRTGIPVSLALVYLEVARRAGLYVEGINFPGRFLLRCPARRGLPYSEVIIDAFRGGALLTRDACRELLRRSGDQTTPGDETGCSSRGCSCTPPSRRSWRGCWPNLKRSYMRMHSFPQARDITDLLVAVTRRPSTSCATAACSPITEGFSGALRDLQRYLELSSSGRLDEEEREEHERIWDT